MGEMKGWQPDVTRGDILCFLLLLITGVNLPLNLPLAARCKPMLTARCGEVVVKVKGSTPS